MSALLRRGSTSHSAGPSAIHATAHRSSRVAALLLTVLLGLGACGDGGTGEDDEEGAPTIGWSLFLAASHQPQLVEVLQRTRPPWKARNPRVIAIRPGEQPPAKHEGTLPYNTLIQPTGPATIWPLGRFGPRTGPDTGATEVHTGTDLSAEQGLPVVAAMDGTVTDVFWDVWGGNRVEVAHVGGLTTTYNHLQYVETEVGDRLQASQRLGTVGQTGLRVTGPHLHFETWVDGEVVDPESFDWIDGVRVIPAARDRTPQVPADRREPLPPALLDTEAIAESWDLPGGELVVGQERGASPEDGETPSSAGPDQEVELLRQKLQELEQELLEAQGGTSGSSPSEGPGEEPGEGPGGEPGGDPAEGPGEEPARELPPIRTSPPTEPSPGGAEGGASELQARVQELEEELAAEQERSQGLEGELEQARTEIVALQTDNQELRGEVERLTAENQGLGGEVERLTAENQGLGGEVERLTTENQRLSSEVQRLTTEMANVMADLQEMRENVEDIPGLRWLLDELERLLGIPPGVVG
ncbi:peptidoglycan DD-metalloendopeptidase family protein [Kocuria sp. M1N1S27]|uniref:peptidoglycan DD-metalloendopeptidase family protein n=1 Tax=Kocuria kalidii TaxID=3376283 RepID=UPI0037B89AA4